MFYNCTKCNKEIPGKEISGIILGDEHAVLSHIGCGGTVERSNWTKTAPTEPGWYWGSCGDDVLVVKIFDHHGRLSINLDNQIQWIQECRVCLWGERLIPPEQSIDK